MADAFKDSFKQFANKKQEILSKLADSHEERIINTLKNLEDEIIADLTSITDGGAKLNTRLAMELRPNLKRLIEQNFLKEADSIVSEYDEIVKEYQRFIKPLPIPDQFKTLTKPDLKVINDLKMLSYSGFEDVGNRFLDTISNEVYQSSVTGRPFNQMVKNIRGQINGVYQRSNETAINRLTDYIDKNRYSDNAQIIAKVKNAREILHTKYASDILGNNMRRYAGQIAQDSLMQFDGQFTLYKGKEADITKFQYVGTNITTTRDFCRRYLDRVFTEEEARSIWQQSWRGKSGTDPFINRGGYRCRHSFILYDDDWFTEETKDNIKKEEVKVQRERNKKSIYGKTSKEEAELLPLAFKGENNQFVKIISTLPALKGIRYMKNASNASYNDNLDRITFIKKTDPSKLSSLSTISHEYGHRIDLQKGRLLKNNTQFHNDMIKIGSDKSLIDQFIVGRNLASHNISIFSAPKILIDKKNLLKNKSTRIKNMKKEYFDFSNKLPVFTDQRVKKITNKVNDIVNEKSFPLNKDEFIKFYNETLDRYNITELKRITTNEISEKALQVALTIKHKLDSPFFIGDFQDYIGSLTRNGLMNGHKTKYYNDFGNVYKAGNNVIKQADTFETFANYSSIKNTLPSYYDKLAYHYAPETTKFYDDMIGVMIKYE